jgi:hypothetical protein
MANVTVTRQIADNAAVGDAAKELLRDDLSPAAYLDLLVAKALFKDAIWFLAHAVPVDVTLRWAVDCVKEFQPQGVTPPEPVKRALALCEQWLKTRSDPDRFEANKSAKEAGLSTPTGCVAMAVFLAGKSMTPAGAPPAPPPPFAAEKMAAGAIRASVLKAAPEKAAQNYNRVLDMGKTIAKGRGAAYFAG